MKKTNPIGLLMLLLMLPQFVETIYSPVLPSVQQHFHIKEESVALTISLYFIAFALGVAFWGIQCDRIGRKKSLEYGLMTYAIGSFIAIFAPNFIILLISRILSAFGIAVGSIVTQTILRDTYDQTQIAKVFSWIGIGLSISPVIGMITGSIFASSTGYWGVFCIVFILAVLFLILSKLKISETHHAGRKIDFKSLAHLSKRMLSDVEIIKSCLLIMGFNVMLFSYYSLAPFIFKQNGFTSYEFGYSSIILAAGTFTGAHINRFLLQKNIPSLTLVRLGVYISFTASIFIWIVGDRMLFLIPFCFIVMAFGISIPNILSTVLIRYNNEKGSAGAVLGLIYYTLIGAGLVAVGFIQQLGISCLIFSGIGMFVILTMKRNEAAL